MTYFPTLLAKLEELYQEHQTIHEIWVSAEDKAAYVTEAFKLWGERSGKSLYGLQPPGNLPGTYRGIRIVYDAPETCVIERPYQTVVFA